MQPKLYTIYTEDINTAYVTAILGAYFDAYTVFHALGCWKGYEEKNLAIQIVTADHSSVYTAAKEIKTLNKQNAVLVTEQPITHNLI